MRQGLKQIEFLAHSDSGELRVGCPEIIIVGLATGLRRDELFSLRREDVDLSLNLINVLDGKVYTGFVVSEGADAILIREPNSVQRELKRAEIEARVQQKQSAMPEGLVANLAPEQLADLLAYLQSLK